jgi:hypothetical protein
MPFLVPRATSRQRPAPPSSPSIRAVVLAALLGALGALPAALHAQPEEDAARAGVRLVARESPDTAAALAGRRGPRFRSPADSVASMTTRDAAERATGLRVIVSLADRVMHVLLDGDTLRIAPVAVASDTTLDFDGRRWTFSTPRGRRVVLGKKQDPVWVPPDWHYAEVARDRGLRLVTLSWKRPTVLADGRRLVVRGRRVGIEQPGAEFAPLPIGEEIILDGTLFVPPFGTENRRIPGELGRHLLDMGDGYLLHGTSDPASIGSAATHGCVRLRDEDVAWLYANIPVGTSVYIY